MQLVLQDFRYALRMLRKNAGLTLVIVLSLAIGVGANSAIFSVVDALLLRPLPYPEPQRLAAVWLHSPGIGIFRDWPSPGQYVDLQTQSHSFEETAISRLRNMTLTGLDQPELAEKSTFLVASAIFMSPRGMLTGPSEAVMLPLLSAP